MNNVYWLRADSIRPLGTILIEITIAAKRIKLSSHAAGSFPPSMTSLKGYRRRGQASRVPDYVRGALLVQLPRRLVLAPLFLRFFKERLGSRQ